MSAKTLRLFALIVLLTAGYTKLSAADRPKSPSEVKVTPLTLGLKERAGNKPVYPPELYAAGISGEVKLAVEIDGGGRVTMAQVLESTERRLEVPAVKAALRLKFKSRSMNGEILLEFKSPHSHSSEPAVTKAAG